MFAEIVFYIHQNPVVSGFVHEAAQWVYSSAKWILRTIVYHLFQSIVYQRFSAKFTTWQQDWFKYFSPKFTSYG